MLRISEAFGAWVDPIGPPRGTGSWKPVQCSLDEYDDDPLDIDILDILRRDEAGEDADFFDDDGSEMAFLEEHDGDELSDG